MKVQMKLLLTLNLLFTVVFLGHIFSIGRKLMYPDNPSVKVYNRNLTEMAFPLTFKLCLFERQNASARYLDIGYWNDYWFFKGRSKFGETFGWNGHSQSNGTIGSVQGMTWTKRPYPDSPDLRGWWLMALDIFGSVRSSRSVNHCPSVRPFILGQVRALNFLISSAPNFKLLSQLS